MTEPTIAELVEKLRLLLTFADPSDRARTTITQAADALEGMQKERAFDAKAIEFAEYMAKDAEQYLAACDEVAALTVGDDVPELSGIEHAESVRSDTYSGLRNGIYEFRKRAAKCKEPA